MALCRRFSCVLHLILIASSTPLATGHDQRRALQLRQISATVASLSPSQDPDAVTNAKTFLQRLHHSSIYLGGFIYIDGGEVLYNQSGNVIIAPENNTYSIDMSSSWTNQTVSLNRIAKSAPVLNSISLWEDASNTSFYAYNGAVSLYFRGLPPPPPNSIWQFTPSGKLGSWSEVNESGSSNFSSLVRTARGLTTYGNGIGYTLGGYQDTFTSSALAGSTPPEVIPNIISYDSTSKTWLNRSATAFTQYGTALNGVLQYVSGFGQAGLVVALGGQNPGNAYPADQVSLLPMDPINLFDPVSGKWATQRANGTIPPVRQDFCAVGLQGDEGTFEIFIYGGATSVENQTEESEVAADIRLDSVYVLSMPAFTWAKANYTPSNPRSLHTCNLAGNRQMVVVGGQLPYPVTVDEQVAPDVWPQGLGVFDLSDMEWKDGYNASASAYTTPAVIKTWYQQNGRSPAQGWDSLLVEAWFPESSASANTTGNSTAGNSTAGNHTAGNGTSPSGAPKNTPTDTGAIAGGVVGGIAGAALVGFLVWFLLRRHRRRHPKTAAESDADKGWSELELADPAAYDPSKHSPSRLPELPDNQLLEAPQSAIHELQ